MMYSYRLAGIYDFFIADMFLAKGQIVSDCSIEQPGVLQNHAELGVNTFPAHV